ncbi:hypothetical protein [Collinsella aerofaciens]|nr:hypothetical protein [Collinsella aerofaciens]MCB5368974.1 hypothetical protein [Collinsella aerofaciens]
MSEKYVSPSQGGCWFCHTAPEDKPMLFDIEFDTYVHEDCLRKALEEEPDHPEAGIMAYLLED